MGRNFRDLTLLPFGDRQLVIACDSSAGIGEKAADQVRIKPEVMAAYCLRVPLLELLCFGAEPVCLVDVIGNELAPTGERMLAGMKAELAKANLSELPLNGSTEENMTTKTSSLGITLLGAVPAAHQLPVIPSGSQLLQLGNPYVANEVVAHLDKIFSYDIVRRLRETTGVYDLLPVGSKGIAYEADIMASTCGRQVRLRGDSIAELAKSAGPATVVLVAAAPTAATKLLAETADLKMIGEFY